MKRATITIIPHGAWELWHAEVPEWADEEWVRENIFIEDLLLNMTDAGAEQYEIMEVEFD